VSNAFFVNNGNLWCSVNGGTPEPIVTGVANLSVLYGVDTFGDESVHQYMTAIQVTAASRWNSVRSADIQLTFNNPLDGQPGQAPTLAPVRRIVPIAQTTSSP
jgi:type IV pilus assembly protein PilW